MLLDSGMDKVELIRDRMNMGITRPFICLTEQGQWFVTKTTAMMPLSQLLAEVIGSILAAEMGLPCPKCDFINIPSNAVLFASPDWKADLPTGTAFSSTYIKCSKVAKTAQAKNPEYLPEQMQKLLYMFDHWILNSDRTASQVGTGNINLLFDEQQQKILVIDHNLAFDEQADFAEHIFAPKNRDWQLDWIDKQNFTDKAIDILKNFDHIYQSIPDDWFSTDDKFLEMENEIDRIKMLLNQITQPNYWDNIE